MLIKGFLIRGSGVYYQTFIVQKLYKNKRKQINIIYEMENKINFTYKKTEELGFQNGKHI